MVTFFDFHPVLLLMQPNIFILIFSQMTLAATETPTSYVFP